MQYLLDTHTIIWFLTGDSNLPVHIKKLIKNIDNNCYVSIVSLWEIVIKMSLGKLNIKGSYMRLYDALIKNKIDILQIEQNHLFKLFMFEFHHRDPFDRMIIAQAVSEDLTLLSRDEIFDIYLSESNTKRIW